MSRARKSSNEINGNSLGVFFLLGVRLWRNEAKASGASRSVVNDLCRFLGRTDETASRYGSLRWKVHISRQLLKARVGAHKI